MKILALMLLTANLACCTLGDLQRRQPYDYHLRQNELGGNGESYSFSWSVRDTDTGSDFGHSENRLQGEGKTNGEYFVLLPDGRLQTVRYSVDGQSGFQARVVYDQDKNEQASPSQDIYYQAPPPPPTAPPSSSDSSSRPIVHSLPAKPLASSPEPPVTAAAAVAPIPDTYSLLIPADPPAYFYQQSEKLLSTLNHLNLETPGKARGGKLQQEESNNNDPYLMTEDQLVGRDFENTFYYPSRKMAAAKDREARKHRKLRL